MSPVIETAAIAPACFLRNNGSTGFSSTDAIPEVFFDTVASVHKFPCTSTF